MGCSISAQANPTLAAFALALARGLSCAASMRFPSVVLPRQECIAASEDILTDNGVRAQGSADMLAVWNAGAGK